MQNRKPLKLAIEYLPIDTVRPSPGNPRKHDNRQIGMIAASMIQHGNVSPLLIDENGVLIAGHGRLEAARLAGYEMIPVVRLRHLSEAQKRSYRIADNRLAEMSSWSIPDLIAEIGQIEIDEPDFDVSLTGFELEEIDAYREGLAPDDGEGEDAIPAPAQTAVTKLGDIWAIGDHRLICGDATRAETYAALLGRERADVVFADPPYNVPIAGHVSGLGKVQHREFLQGTGEMTDEQFQHFLLSFMLLCVRFAKPGSLHFVCMDWRHMRHLLLAGAAAYDEQINLCVWAKPNPGMGSLYRSAYELIAVFKKGKVAHRNNVRLGANGRNRSNVWHYAGMSSPTRDRAELLALHPTVKPLAMVRDILLDVTSRGNIVVDPFGGSGTTLLAADRVNRVARLIELDPLYCDVILRRAAASLKVMPRLVATGQSFDVVEAFRMEAVHG